MTYVRYAMRCNAHYPGHRVQLWWRHLGAVCMGGGLEYRLGKIPSMFLLVAAAAVGGGGGGYRGHGFQYF